MIFNQSTRPRVVIVGAGFAGLAAAVKLRNLDADVIIVDRSNHHLFQPLLYQVATAALSPNDIAVPVRSIFRNQENVSVILGEVTQIDPTPPVIRLSDGRELAYDYLILAMGAETNYFNHPQWARYSIGLKDVDDALDIRQRILLAFEAAESEKDPDRQRDLLTFVVIGGGPTGVELAGAFAELAQVILAKDFRHIFPGATRVILIEMADRLLTAFHPSLSEKAKTTLERLGVEVLTRSRVQEIESGRVHLDNRSIAASTICWTAGVRPNTLTLDLPFEKDERGYLKVKGDCSVYGHGNVFAVGDVASLIPQGQAAPLPGLAPVAKQQGRYVGAQIRRRILNKASLSDFRYFDKGIMATIGRSKGLVEVGTLRWNGFLAWIAWLLVHVWYLIDFRNRIMVLLQWFWAYITFKRGARLITARSINRSAPVEQRESLERGQLWSSSAPGVSSQGGF